MQTHINPTAHLVVGSLPRESGCQLQVLEGVLANRSAVECQNALCLGFSQGWWCLLLWAQESVLAGSWKPIIWKWAEPRAIPSTTTTPLLNACCIVLDKPDVLGLQKNTRLQLQVSNYLRQIWVPAQHASMCNWLLQDEGTCLFNHFKSQKKLYNDEVWE